MPGGMLCAEAHAGIQVTAIPENRMNVMRRMGDLPLGRALTARRTIYSHIAGAHHCEVGHTGRFFCRRLAWSPRAQSRQPGGYLAANMGHSLLSGPRS